MKLEMKRMGIKLTILLGLLSLGLISCGDRYGFNDVISDNQCSIIEVSEDGAMSVYPYIKDNKKVYSVGVGYHRGLGKMTPELSAFVRDLVERNIEKDYVCASIDSDGIIEIICLDPSNGREVTFQDYVSRMRNDQ